LSPYEYYDHSLQDIQGYSTDVVRAVFFRLNINISEHKVYPWRRGLESVYKGTFDAIHSASKNKERTANCWVPDEPLITSSKVLLINKENIDKLKFESLDDLTNKNVATVIGFEYPDGFMPHIKKQENHTEVVRPEQHVNIKKSRLHSIREGCCEKIHKKQTTWQRPNNFSKTLTNQTDVLHIQ